MKQQYHKIELTIIISSLNVIIIIECIRHDSVTSNKEVNKQFTLSFILHKTSRMSFTFDRLTTAGIFTAGHWNQSIGYLFFSSSGIVRALVRTSDIVTQVFFMREP